MKKSRRIRSPFAPRIRNRQEYRAALEKLETLSRVAMGTLGTEGLQELIDAIFEYEARRARGTLTTLRNEQPKRDSNE